MNYSSQWRSLFASAHVMGFSTFLSDRIRAFMIQDTGLQTTVSSAGLALILALDGYELGGEQSWNLEVLSGALASALEHVSPVTVGIITQYEEEHDLYLDLAFVMT